MFRLLLRREREKDIFRGVRDDMRDGELGGGDSLHQVFVLSQVRGNPGDVRKNGDDRKFHRGRPSSSAYHPSIRRTLLHDVVLHQLGSPVFPGVFHLSGYQN